jgi:hypothetical protein
MAHYIAYLIGRDSHLMKVVDLICDDDDDAIRCARPMVDGHGVELWQRDRRVAKFDGMADTPEANSIDPRRNAPWGAFSAD